MKLYPVLCPKACSPGKALQDVWIEPERRVRMAFFFHSGWNYQIRTVVLIISFPQFDFLCGTLLIMVF